MNDKNMMALSRLTTQYHVVQDRIRLAGETQNGQAVVLWITQRLLNKLLQHICKPFEKSVPRSKIAPVQDFVQQSFAQQRARVELPRQKPVTVDQDCLEWLVLTTEVKIGAGGVGLVFCGANESEKAAIVFALKPLRQWLNILHDQSQVAGWSMAMWPAWIKESASLAKPDQSVALH
jgi:hypothetical protein